MPEMYDYAREAIIPKDRVIGRCHALDAVCSVERSAVQAQASRSD